MIYAISGSFVLLVWLTIVYLNERHGLLSCDRFSSAAAKWFAYLWLGALMLGLALVVTRSALHPPSTKNMSEMPFWSIFELHIILLIFLFGWWAATGFPKLRQFLNIRHEKPAEVVAIGVSVGVGGWILTLIISAIIVLLLQATGVLEKAPAPPAAIGWMAALPLWKKALIVLSAMTVEEAFFRSFLQKRIGLIASTVLFALAHFTYGNPVLLVGVTVISIIIGLTFYRTKNVIPGVLAHGVFDAVQLFVIVPLAYKLISAGS